MPKIVSSAHFTAFYEQAFKVFQSSDLSRYRYPLASGMSLYRYVSYRDSMPQAADAGKTLWLSPEQDVNNRWTGWGGTGDTSGQGLYFSNEYLQQNKPFPELEHYMDTSTKPDAMIAYIQYRPGVDPTLYTANASELRSMFLFTSNKPLTGLNLKLYTAPGQTHPLLETILDQVRMSKPGLLGAKDTLASLYTSENADFCRAVGNACLKAVADIDCFETLSVRDGKSANTVMRAEPRTPLAVVDAKGRATFFVSNGMVGQGAYTVSDMIYNVTFDDENAGKPFDMPSRENFRTTLANIGDQFCGNMLKEYQQLLKNAPPDGAVEQVGQQLLKVQTSLQQQNYKQAMQDIALVQQSIKTLDVAHNQGLKANEIQALKMSQSVMNSLAEMAKSIDLADRDISGHQDLDPGNVDISDPEPDLLDPTIKTDPVHH